MKEETFKNGKNRGKSINSQISHSKSVRSRFIIQVIFLLYPRSFSNNSGFTSCEYQLRVCEGVSDERRQRGEEMQRCAERGVARSALR